MDILSWLVRATMWMYILNIFVYSKAEEQVLNMYVSQRKGNDSMTCGSITKPCKTIVMGVSLAAQNTRVYVDGTGSETTPYTCKSSSSELPGIHTKKSLEIVGVQSTTHVKCQEGHDVRFEKSLLNGTETVVRLINIKFVNTTVRGLDTSLNINECIFSGAAQGISVALSTRSVALSFSNSLCMNTSSCIKVEASGHMLPKNNISIDIRNSNVVSSWFTEGQPASGIHVTSSDNDVTPGLIQMICDIKLHDVTFKYNTLGKNGLIFVVLKNSFTSLSFNNVLFSENKAEQHTISLITVINSKEHFMVFNNTRFVSCGGLCRAVNVSARSQSLIIKNSRFEQFSVGSQFGVLNLQSLKDCNVSMETTTFANNNGTMGDGGCMLLNTSGTATVVLKDSLYVNNTGRSGGVFWLFAKNKMFFDILNCHFESNFASVYGGLARVTLGIQVSAVIMTNSTVINSTAQLSGGVFDIRSEFPSSPIKNTYLIFRNIHVSQIHSAWLSAGLLILHPTNGNLEIHDSVIHDMYVMSGGLLVANYESTLIDITIKNTSLKNIISAQECSVMDVRGIGHLSLENFTIDSTYFYKSYGEGGAFCFADQLHSNSSFKLNNVIVKNCSGRDYIHRGYGALLFEFISSENSVTITNSIFESNTADSGGCLGFLPGTPLGSANIFIHNVTFKECYSRHQGAGAVSLYIANGQVTIDSTRFIGNVAFRGDGGALFFAPLSVGGDKVKDDGCLSMIDKAPSTHRTWYYGVSILINNSIFVNNTAVNGGALALSTGQHTIKECSFIDNFAQIQGGHIFMTSDSTTLHVINSELLQKHSSMTVKSNGVSITYRLSLGAFINSQSLGPLMIHNSTLESIISQGTDLTKLVFVSKENYISLGGNNKTLVKCPRGSMLDIVNITNVIDTEYKKSRVPCKMALTQLGVSCIPCKIDAYSLQRGHSLGKNKVSGFQCLSCPYGAVCNSKISAKPNFWGYKVKENPVELNFTLCPLGYCKTPSENDFLDYNSCQGNRSGTLCGHCKDNYSETLLSPSCRHDDECHDNWLWGVAVIMVTLMALYLIHKPGLLRLFKKQILWFRCQRKEDNQQDEAENHGGGGYLKMVFYFYQVVNILLVTNSYEKVIQSNLVHPVVGIFNFQFRFSRNGFLCPFPGLTAVTKQLLFASQVLGVVFMIAVSYVFQLLLRKCRSKPPPNIAPYLGAVLETLLLGYSVFANTSLQLLRCTSLGQNSHLFIAGQVVCYQWWQYLLMVFVGAVVFPFILTLAFGSHWLYKGTISVKEFLLCCVLPLPYLVYKLILFMCSSKRPCQEPVEWRASVTNVLYGPFRIPQESAFGAVYWESILVSRRLLLILIYVFVSDPFLKEILLTLSCVSILLHHTIVQPFHDVAANIVEIVSLFNLIVIAAINTFKASFLSTGQEVEGPLKSIAVALDWVQLIILIVLPVLVIVAVIFSIVSLVIRCIREVHIFAKSCWIRCQETSDEGRRLLNPFT